MAKGEKPGGKPGGDENVEEISREIAHHQREFWRFFSWLRRATSTAVIWGVLFLLLWLLRDFFPLLFLTFVACFITTSATHWLGRRMPGLGWKTRVVCVFTSILLILAVVIWLLIPQIKLGAWQLKQTVQDLPSKWEQEIDPWLFENIGLYRNLVRIEAAEPADVDETGDAEAATETAPTVAPDLSETAPPPDRVTLWEVDTVREFLSEVEGDALKTIPEAVTDVVTFITAMGSLLFLSMLFSFLIVLDFDTLRREVRKLENTKLHDFYRGTARDIVKFGAVLGKVLEAQAVIALVNTLLTAIGLWALGVPNVAFLCLGVFVCGFIPVAGVFISSVPICLVGLIQGGPSLFIMLVIFITVIHMIEAYVLNPRIMGATLRVNPVLVLIILVVGHHALGVWGLLLGLPICYYFFTHVIKREEREIGLRATFKKGVGAKAS